MDYFLGIDSSTTATKALLIDNAGSVIDTASSEYTYETPHPLWSEQHPNLWWDATVSSIRQVLTESAVEPNRIQGIGLTGQMHGLTLLDESGQVLRPAILWNDQRTADECDEIRELLGKEHLIRITGNNALTGFTAPKILWVRNNEPDLFGNIHQILLPKDYIRYKLTGDYATDKAGGAGTLLFDIAKREWAPEVLSTLQINREWLPPTYEGTAVTGEVSPAAAEATGLEAATPVVAGAGDQAAAAVGTGAVIEGIVSLSLGTSGVVFSATEQPLVEPEGRLHAFCHAVPNTWHLMGVMLSAGGTLRWYRDTLAPESDFDELIAPAADIAPGSDGLFLLPYLTGERTPHSDPLARGAFVGLTVRHSQAHMTRAVLEGVSFGLRDSFELMKSVGVADISQIRTTGGGVNNSLWRQILADVFQTELVTVNTVEGAAYGAALLAAVSADAFSTVAAACNTVIQVTNHTSPGPASDHYEESYHLYRGLYPALRDSLHAISRLDEQQEV